MTLKTKTINTGKATILVVESPKGADEVRLKKGRMGFRLKKHNKTYHEDFFKLPQGNWKPQER